MMITQNPTIQIEPKPIHQPQPSPMCHMTMPPYSRSATAWLLFISVGASPTRSTSIEQSVMRAAIAPAAASHGAMSAPATPTVSGNSTTVSAPYPLPV